MKYWTACEEVPLTRVPTTQIWPLKTTEETPVSLGGASLLCEECQEQQSQSRD